MEGFDPATSFGYDVSKRYDKVGTRGGEEQTVAFVARIARQMVAVIASRTPAMGCATPG